MMGRTMLAVAVLDATSVTAVVIMQMTSMRANGGRTSKLVSFVPSQTDSPDTLEASDSAKPAPTTVSNQIVLRVH